MIGEGGRALAALVVVVDCLQALDLDFGQLAGACLRAGEPVEAVLRIILSVGPYLVVPAVVHVLAHREDVRPGRVVVGALENDLISEQCLVLDVLQEPLDLPQHTDMLSLEAEADDAGTVNLLTFLRVRDKDVIEGDVIVQESAEDGSRSQVVLQLRNGEGRIGVDGRERRQLAAGDVSSRLIVYILADLIANSETALASRHHRGDADSADLVSATAGEGAADVLDRRDLQRVVEHNGCSVGVIDFRAVRAFEPEGDGALDNRRDALGPLSDDGIVISKLNRVGVDLGNSHNGRIFSTEEVSSSKSDRC